MPSSTSTLINSKRKLGTHGSRLRAGGRQISNASRGDAGNDHDIFFWTYTEEPHRTRRHAIIKAHPEVFVTEFGKYDSLLTLPSQVTKLCGPEPLTKYLVTAVVLLQVLCAYLLQNKPFLSWRFFLT